MSSISIKGLTKASVLAALYNRSVVQGMGALHAQSGVMTEQEAQKLLDNNASQYFDYLKGRVLKLDLSIDPEIEELDTWLYNRDNGVDAAERLIAKLRSESNES